MGDGVRNGAWIRDAYAAARSMILGGAVPTVDVHRDGDGGRVVKILLMDGEQSMRIVWGKGTMRDTW